LVVFLPKLVFGQRALALLLVIQFVYLGLRSGLHLDVCVEGLAFSIGQSLDVATWLEELYLSLGLLCV